MDFNKFFQSKIFKAILGAIIGVIIFLFIFGLGAMVGARKAHFSYMWSENYHRNFAGPRGGFFSDFSGKDFIEANGAFGQIIKIDGSTLVVKGHDNTEKIILINNDTTIMRFKETVKLTDLEVNDFIVTIGEPNNSGQIEAKLIRLLPPPPPMGMPYPTSSSSTDNN